MMNLGLGWQKEFFTREEIEVVEWSNTTKFVLYRTRSAPARTDRWIVECERTIQETGVIEQIIIFSADTEFSARKSFRTLRRVTGYVNCDNDVAIPGLF
jgi:hypothetical protein